MIQEQNIEHQNIYGQKSFKISIEALEHQFTCTVCLNPIEDCYVTRCGHVYCKACIQQTLNRHHRCPFCNQQLKEFKEDVFKNYHFNTIKKIIEEQKMKESSKYLKKVFASDYLNKIQQETEELEKLLRPIEKKIVGFCENALLEYRKFVIGLFDVEKLAEEKKSLHGSKNIRDHNQIIEQLQKTVVNCLKNPIISSQIMELPTQIELIIPGNKTIKKNLKVSPLATYESLLPCIENICSENNIHILGKIEEQLTINTDKFKLTDRLGLNAGAKLKIESGIPFESKVYCYTFNWFKDKASDFKICKDCGVKWICENCALHCHSGHQVVPHLKEHKPDWAICYCVNKCECKAINKNSVDQ